jgi:hypothetical protein
LCVEPVPDAVRELIREYVDWLGVDLAFQGLEGGVRATAIQVRPSDEGFVGGAERCRRGGGLHRRASTGDIWGCEMKRLYRRARRHHSARGHR